MLATQVPWAATVALLVMAPGTATADWRAEGTPVGVSSSPQTLPVICDDGKGGAYIAWQQLQVGRIQLQHFSAAGVPAPGWPSEGLFGAEARFGWNPILAPDGQGGVFIAWRSGHSLNYGRISADGAFSTTSAERSTASASIAPLDVGIGPSRTLKEPTYREQALVPDGAGRAYLIWSYDSFYAGFMVQLGRISSSGAPDPAWPWGFGMDTTYYTFQHVPVGCPDGEGGVIVAWRDADAETGTDILACRMTGDGAIAPGWTRTGNPVCRYPGNQDAIGIASDGAGGALFAWQDERESGREQTFAQHLTATGVPAPGWAAGGISVSRYATAPGVTRFGDGIQRYSSVAPDGAGGMYVVWSDQRADGGDIYCQRLLADGRIAPGWRADGLPVCTAAGVQTHPSLAPDGAGGVLLAWEDRRGAGADIYAARLAGDGTPVVGWPPQGQAVCERPADQTMPVVAPGLDGAAIAAWQDDRCGPTRILASRLGADGSVPAGDPVLAPSAVWLGWETVDARLRVAWHVTADSGTAVVYRADNYHPWQALATIQPDAVGRVEFADSTILAGCAYGYRLSMSTCGPTSFFGETWVDVPEGAGISRPTARLLSATASNSEVTVVWQAPTDTSVVVRAEREEPCGSWAAVSATPDSLGVVRAHSLGLFEGRRYGYRLILHACGREEALGETWVEVPIGQGFLRTSAESIQAELAGGIAHLAWRVVTGPATTARVYRIRPGAAWAMVASFRLAGTNVVRYDDRDLVAGTPVGYRVGLQYESGPDCRSPEELFAPVWLEVPEEPVVQLDLRLRANPTKDEPEVSLALPGSDPAWLELYDPRGRLLWRRDVAPLGRGNHPLRLSELAGRPAGIYLLRVRQQGQSRTVRLSVLR
jgi:hypothetical protein